MYGAWARQCVQWKSRRYCPQKLSIFLERQFGRRKKWGFQQGWVSFLSEPVGGPSALLEPRMIERGWPDEKWHTTRTFQAQWVREELGMEKWMWIVWKKALKQREHNALIDMKNLLWFDHLGRRSEPGKSLPGQGLCLETNPVLDHQAPKSMILGEVLAERYVSVHKRQAIKLEDICYMCNR